MALTQKQVQDVCLLYQGHTQCRYLDEDTDDQGNVVAVCRKLTLDKSIIDEEVDRFLDESKKNNQDPRKQGVALGDNCVGYLKLTNKKQGYDI